MRRKVKGNKMGIAKSIASLIVEQHSHHPFGGKLLQFGRQKIQFRAVDLLRIFRQNGLRAVNERVLLSIKDKHRNLSDIEFWGAFGFTSIEVLDVYDHENAEVIHDLNQDSLPEVHHGQYQVVFDGGTMEHVFHTPNVLKNIFHLLAVGGRVIHLNPASNSVDHGFFSFSPCLYYEYYNCNEFVVESAQLLNLGTRLSPISVTGYVYPLDRKAIDGYLTGNVHYNWFVCTKTERSTCSRIPQQGAYQSIWKASKEKKQEQKSPENSRGLSRIRRFINDHPTLRHFAHYPFIRFWRRRSTRRTLQRIGKKYRG